jgi:hypothetical protein
VRVMINTIHAPPMARSRRRRSTCSMPASVSAR